MKAEIIPDNLLRIMPAKGEAPITVGNIGYFLIRMFC